MSMLNLIAHYLDVSCGWECAAVEGDGKLPCLSIQMKVFKQGFMMHKRTMNSLDDQPCYGGSKKHIRGLLSLQDES
jgi:hypothetical protein